MNLPIEISQKVLNELASPDDRRGIRIVLLQVANSGPQRIRGKRRQYIFMRNNEIGAHTLDVPDSLWQHDLPKGPYRENLSICHDLQNVMGIKIPLVFLQIPWGEPAEQEEVPATEVFGVDPMVKLREVLKLTGAPEIIFAALDLALANDISELTAMVDMLEREGAGTDEAPVIGDQDKPNPSPQNPPPVVKVITGPNTPTAAQALKPAPEKAQTPAAERMRKMRERKRLEKEAAESQAVEKPAAKKAAKKTPAKKAAKKAARIRTPEPV